MKSLRLFVTVLAIICVAAAALAGCPDSDGEFSYLIGEILDGHVSEAWCGGAPGETGNTLNGMSWDGTNLGDQWKIWDLQIDALGAQLVFDGVDALGNGNRMFQTSYTGGEFWMSKDGAWGDHVNDVGGIFTVANVNTMFTYVSNVVVGANSNIYLTGTVADCDGGCVIEYVIANTALVATITGGTALPANYPPFLCGATDGEAFEALTIRMEIQCKVPSETSSWSTIKTLYR